MLLALFTVGALAGPGAYSACCTAAGAASCPTELEATGPGSRASLEGGATRITGLWQLSCANGTRFDEAHTRLLQSDPGTGVVLSAIGPVAIACWDAACAMPPGLCLEDYISGARLVRCADSQPAPTSTWMAPAAPGTTPVVVDGRVIAAVAADPLPSRAEGRSPAAAAPPPSAPLQLDAPIPAAPPMPCVPNPALRAPSREQVNTGNAAAVAGDWVSAASNYIAAITIDVCNPFAWADLGEAFLVSGDAARARNALRTATQLMPQHYQAWTNLGLAEEALGRTEEAYEAFSRALESRSDHPAALEGRARTGGP